MNASIEFLLSSLLRTGAILTVSAVAVAVLFRIARIGSPTIRRFACFAVILQGCLLVQWPVAIAWLSFPAAPETTSLPSRGGPLPQESTAAMSSIIPAQFMKSALSLSSEASAETVASDDAVTSLPWAECLAGIWVTGIVVLLARSLLNYRRFIRCLPPVVNENREWHDEWAALQQREGLRNLIPLHVTQVEGPMLCRLLGGYRLLVPAGLWSRLDSPQRLAILRHEVAHVRRRDVWKSLGVRILALPHWFNPLVWWTVKQFDEAAEWACDEVARSAAPQHATDHARALLRLGESTETQLLFGASVRGRGLAFRIRRLLVPVQRKDSRMKTLTMAMLFLGVTLFNCLDFRLAADEPPDNGSRTYSTSVTSGVVKGFVVDADDSQNAATFLHVTDAKDMRASSHVLQYYAGDGVRREGTKAFAYRAAPKPDADVVFVQSGNQAVVDVAYLFKNLDEFKREREALKKEIKSQEEQIQRRLKAARAANKELQNLRGQDDADEAAVSKITIALAQMKAEMDVERQVMQKNFLNREAAIYEFVYNKIKAEIAAYAKEHRIRIVRRFIRPRKQEKPSDSSSNPRDILRRMNQDVLYVERDDFDITDEILKRLNAKDPAATSATAN